MGTDGGAGKRRVAVVGAGVTGLAATLDLYDRLGDQVELTLIEQSERAGGKLSTGVAGDLVVERGAETFLMRDPDGTPSPAVRLARRVGLGDAIRHPAGLPAALAIGGELLDIPPGTLMGIPGRTDLAGVARVDTSRDTDSGVPLLGPDEDVAVGALVRRRLGDEVVDRLVDPLLGGVYAGRADDLSLVTTIPALARACRTGTTLLGAVGAVLAAAAAVRPATGAPSGPAGPVFGTVEGGLSRLVEAATAILASLSTVDIRYRAAVRDLRPVPGGGWRLVLGPTVAPQVVEVDAVILALPSHPAARLLAGAAAEAVPDRSALVAPVPARRSGPGLVQDGGAAPTAVVGAPTPVGGTVADAARLVGVLDYASVALVTLVLPGPVRADLSGFLVPATEGYAVKAMTNFTAKWPHRADPAGLTVLRASLGRSGDTEVLQRDDADLVTLVRAELGRLLGADLAVPVASQVTRWGGGLPQYAPGHANRVEAARAALPGTVALAGAGYDGIGIPACVRSGHAAAARIAAALTQ